MLIEMFSSILKSSLAILSSMSTSVAIVGSAYKLSSIATISLGPSEAVRSLTGVSAFLLSSAGTSNPYLLETISLSSICYR